MKPIIGSKYHGPDFQRPSLRQLPRGWVLEETRANKYRWWRDPDLWAVVAVVVVGLLVIGQSIAAWR